METLEDKYIRRSHEWINGPWYCLRQSATNEGNCVGDSYNWLEVFNITIDPPVEDANTRYEKITEIHFVSACNSSITHGSQLSLNTALRKAMTVDLNNIKEQIDSKNKFKGIKIGALNVL